MSQPPILPLKLGRKQSHPRIPVVRSHATANRLEKRMDRPLPTPYHILNTRHRKGLLLLKNNQHS
jgi:hypothetical protein